MDNTNWLILHNIISLNSLKDYKGNNTCISFVTVTVVSLAISTAMTFVRTRFPNVNIIKGPA